MRAIAYGKPLLAPRFAWVVLMVSIGYVLGLSPSPCAEESNPRQDSRPDLALTDAIGLTIGEKIPQFHAFDQNGDLRDFASIRGPKGAVIYFYRSASW